MLITSAERNKPETRMYHHPHAGYYGTYNRYPYGYYGYPYGYRHYGYPYGHHRYSYFWRRK